MILKSDVKFKEKLICCFKNDKNLANFDLSTQVSKIRFVIGSFCAKYIKFDQKITEEFSFMTLKSHAKFQENWFVVWKMKQGI